jgi:TAG lipase/steryl ester hydrolase/phospholipase A2/LPA acyltransferase
MSFSATKRLQADMDAATSYDEWKDAAIAYDKGTNLERWKSDDESSHFDHTSIRRRLVRLRKLRKKKDYPGVLYALNEGVHGNIDGIGRADLYNKAKFGTKKLIVDYIDEVTECLELLASPAADEIPNDERLSFFKRAYHCYGCSALMMSGAGSLLFFHVGVVKVLWKQRLLPDILSGSSGGAIVGSLASTQTDKDLEIIFDPEHLVHEIKRDESLFRHLDALKPSIASADEVSAVLERLIPDLTFQEAFEKTGRHLNVSIAAAERHQSSRLLNAITTPNVYVRDAIMASSAVPGFYPPVALNAKNDQGERQAYMPSRKWVDGSLSHDLPGKRLSRLYGVNHFLVSQVNPHIFPFVTDAKGDHSLMSTITLATKRTAREWINATASILEKPLSLSPAVNRITNVALGIINQDYVGDINILPEKQFFNPLKLLAHRSTEEIMDLIAMGEKATFPKIEMIRVQTKISRTLSEILKDFDHRSQPVDHHSLSAAS